MGLSANIRFILLHGVLREKISGKSLHRTCQWPLNIVARHPEWSGVFLVNTDPTAYGPFASGSSLKTPSGATKQKVPKSLMLWASNILKIFRGLLKSTYFLLPPKRIKKVNNKILESVGEILGNKESFGDGCSIFFRFS